MHSKATPRLPAGRFFGTRWLERFGQTLVLVIGGSLACLGMLAGALGTSVWLVFAGSTFKGLGLASIFPTCLARAGALGGPTGISVAVTLGYGGFLPGPPAIGFLAGTFGLRIALITLAFLSGAAAVIAYVTRNAEGQAADRARGTAARRAPASGRVRPGTPERSVRLAGGTQARADWQRGVFD